jgi:hypothetical protein
VNNDYWPALGFIDADGISRISATTSRRTCQPSNQGADPCIAGRERTRGSARYTQNESTGRKHGEHNHQRLSRA